ncbi:MAG: CatA-like O-acetyltransferase [Nostoc sp.]|uniref:CatA-like O-acetyltransferase n=1 Tax=Nostoc sp. TaxID=1180 RepID=UPI002FF6BE29
MIISIKYQPRLLDDKAKEGYLNWSLDFFTDPNAIQVPCIDLTIQLEVTNAYKMYQSNPQEGATFFSFLIWHLVQTLKNHFSFNLRLIENQWYILDNPPVIIPVAVGGQDRFWEMLLENISQMSYPEFISQYRQKLERIRKGKGQRVEPEIFSLSCGLGNLPNLQFTGLTLNWRRDEIIGQPYFYFGKRYWQNNQLFIPFAAKLHHACNDPFVFDLLIQDFQQRFINNTDT